MRKILSLFMGLMLVLAGVTVAASPAQAATINGCQVNNVCLYDWINNNYASGFWQRNGAYLSTGTDGGVSGCTNLASHQWHDLDGSPNGTASSLMINWGPIGGAVRRIEFFDYFGCGAGGGYSFYYLIASTELVTEVNLNDLNYCDAGSCGLAWENRISSIRLTTYVS